MEKERKGGRGFKSSIFHILESENIVSALEKLERIPDIKVVNALFSFLYNTDPRIKWAAVSVLGTVVARIAHDDMESARVIMRRLMWNLNDESGGIGWGSPEAMGEVLARSEPLAEEYATILLSHAREDGNYLEHEILQRGLLWGIGRLAQAKPHHIQNFAQHLAPYLRASDPNVRGLATWICGFVDIKGVSRNLERLRGDKSEIQIYVDEKIRTYRISDLAGKALEK